MEIRNRLIHLVRLILLALVLLVVFGLGLGFLVLARRKRQVTVRVVVRRHLKPKLRAWRETLGSTDLERTIWYRVLIGELERRLRRHNGFPPEAAPHCDGNSTIYYWNFILSVMIQFSVEESPPPPQRWWDLEPLAALLMHPHMRTVTIEEWSPYP